MSPLSGVSPWTAPLSTPRRRAYPHVTRDEQADVVIVGGGLTGCATAHACAAAGLKTVLVEAATLGSGATALTSGLLLPEPGPSFRSVVDAHGLRAGRSVFTTWRKAAVDGSQLLARLRVRCGLTALDSVRVGGNDDERTLRREHEARHEAGLDADWLSARQVQSLAGAGHTCGIRTSAAFSLDPCRAALGLASAAHARRARIFEHSPVRRITVGRRHVEAVTEGGTITAGTVVVATGSPTTLFAPLVRHVAPRDRFFVLTDVMPAAMRRHLWRTDVTVQESAPVVDRFLWTAEHQALVVGSEQAAAPARRADAAIKEWTFELMYELLKRYPVISGLTPVAGWRLTTAVTRDGLPFIGPHRNYPRHLFALGGSGDGSVTASFLAARLLVRALTGSTEKADAVFGFTR